MRFVAIAVIVLLILGCSKGPETAPPKASAGTTNDEQYRREMDEVRKNIKEEVRVKLKRDGKSESYSWEISGKDANEVLRANDTLNKKLNK